MFLECLIKENLFDEASKTGVIIKNVQMLWQVLSKTSLTLYVMMTFDSNLSITFLTTPLPRQKSTNSLKFGVFASVWSKQNVSKSCSVGDHTFLCATSFAGFLVPWKTAISCSKREPRELNTDFYEQPPSVAARSSCPKPEINMEKFSGGGGGGAVWYSVRVWKTKQTTRMRSRINQQKYLELSASLLRNLVLVLGVCWV